jgi:hypothetical protein
VRHDRTHQVPHLRARPVYGDNRQIDIEGADLLHAAEPEVNTFGEKDLQSLEGGPRGGAQLDGGASLTLDGGAVERTAPLEGDVYGDVVLGSLALDIDEADAFARAELGRETDLDAELMADGRLGLGEDGFGIGVLPEQQEGLTEVGIDEDLGYALEGREAFTDGSPVGDLVQPVVLKRGAVNVSGLKCLIGAKGVKKRIRKRTGDGEGDGDGDGTAGRTP